MNVKSNELGQDGLDVFVRLVSYNFLNMIPVFLLCEVRHDGVCEFWVQ